MGKIERGGRMRLIDADRLWFERPEFLNPIKEGQEEFNKGWNACIKVFGKLIDNQPTVENKYAWDEVLKELNDMVEECEYYGDVGSAMGLEKAIIIIKQKLKEVEEC